MRKVIRERIRRQKGGVNVAADVDAVIAANTGSSQRQQVRVQSRRTVVQGSGRQAAERPEETQPQEKEGT